MTRSAGPWRRVSKRRPCPICGKPDWCLYAGPDDAPQAAICPRTESDRQAGEAGWLHVLRNDGPTWAPWRLSVPRALRVLADDPKADFGRLAERYRAATNPQAVEKLATHLGVSRASLDRLGIGWSHGHKAWTFPMGDVAGRVRGIRLRLPGGRKLSVKGGREGLFIPASLDASDRLLIAEGPTDTAALLDLEFAAVGRPSCTGGLALLVEAVSRGRPAKVVIVADGDPPGQQGARAAARRLLAYAESVQVVSPPAGIKDVRTWKQAGATRADVAAAIEAASPSRLAVSVRKAG